MDDLYSIPAATRKLMLENMVNSPAFALFCDAWDEHVRTQIDAKIFDPTTSDATTRELRIARGQLTGTRHPRKVVETMIRVVSTEARQQPKNKETRP